MASRNRRRLRNHTYIEDAIIYTNYVFNKDGYHVQMKRVWEKWHHSHTNATPKIDKIMSYSNGYVVNDVVDVKVCGNIDFAMVTTLAGRRLTFGLDSSVITDNGPLPVRNLGFGTKLLAVDNYKYYYGDHLSLRTDGNSRVRALLRNHNVPFEVGQFDNTLIEGYTIHCFDHNTDGPVVNGAMISYGLNNYREGVKALLGLPDYTYDEVVKVKPWQTRKYGIALYMGGPQNVVMTNGLIIQSTQTEVIDDW